ncbi:MAG: MBL fold metallo-hydrolase [Mariprofundales bacterium]
MSTQTMLHNADVTMISPTCLFRDGEHIVYWLGIADETTFRCNTYLIKDGEQTILIDPGSSAWFKQVKQRVTQIMPPENISAIVLCHQDPDVAASFPDWLKLNPDILICSSMRAHVLLPHYGCSNFRFHDVSANNKFRFASGRELQFIDASFLHSPAAFVSFDTSSGFLFSGDIWAALTIDWSLCVQDFSAHCANMDMFHMDYMASNIAARGFLRQLKEHLANNNNNNNNITATIEAILPQHGSIIPKEYVESAIEYLHELQCGIDLLYPDLSRNNG